MKVLPQWVKDFNAKKMVDKYYEEGWNTLYPLNAYDQSAQGAKAFLYSLKQYAGKNYEVISATPYGNTFTIEMAKTALIAEQLGKDSITDFLAVSLSSPDYIGHSFGPNSIETEDNYLRLDKDLGDFLNFLDEKVGPGQYLVFLTADHGTAHVPGFLKQHNIPAGNVDTQTMFDKMNKLLQQKFGADNLVADISNYQVYLDHAVIKNDSLDAKEIRKWVIEYVLKQPGIARAFELDALAATTLNATIKDMIANGYYAARSGDIQLIFQPQWIEGFENGGTTHGLWNPYDAHIPLLWYGWNIKQGTSNREINMTDIAPTIAALLHIQMPSGCVGHVIEEITK